MSAHPHPASSALIQAVAASRPALVRQAQRMLRGSCSAEDAAQDAMVAALSNLERFRGDAHLSTWLYRVAANAVLMTLRRERRATQRTARALSLLPRDASWLHGSAGSNGAQHQLEEAQSAQLLRWTIEQLPERYRAVVLKCDIDERPLDEVAVALGITVGGVRTRRLRAHRMLKDALRGARESAKSGAP